MTKKDTPIAQSRGELEAIGKTIVETFTAFNAPVKIVESVEGLRQFHFYLELEKPVRMKAIAGFKDDLCYALSNKNVEIIAPIPDKKLIGVTVAKSNPVVEISSREIYKTKEFLETSSLTVPLGVDEFGEKLDVNIARMPHALIAGATGSGKSVVVHTLIAGLIEKNSPDEVRFILIDPKKVELTLYNGLPHLLTPCITSAKKTIQALSWSIKEMERRYDILEAEGLQNISSYHKNLYKPAKAKWVKRGSKGSEKDKLPEPLPYIIIVVDEMNDLMQAYPKEIEACVIRLAQMSRAVGIHMILSTQRPSVNVITGSIKANLPTRIALMVASQVDSRTIIDSAGAEKLAGEGDMLYLASDSVRPVRAQSYFTSEDEVRARVKKCIKEYSQDVTDTINLEGDRNSNDSIFNSMVGGDDGDDLYEDAKKAVIEAGKASTSYIQRKLRIGYSRAARLMDLLEEGGVIGPADGSKPREVTD
jgi:S-DNA-T family DNA segregation ATPase FtsK/SpoIIIE